MAEALGITGTVLAIVELSAKIGSHCVEYYKAVKNAGDDITRVMEEVNGLRAIASNALELLKGPRGAELKASGQLVTTVRRAEDLLKQLESKLRPSTAREVLSRMHILRALKWPFKSKEIEGVVKDIEQCTRTLSIGLQLDIAVGVLDIDEKLALDKLPTAPGASYDSQAEELSATCLPNTRVELLQKIRAWANDPTSQAVFWLKGMAGTGKSTVSRTVAQEMAEHRQLGASFFFKRGEADRSNASKVFTTMALQLVSHLPMLAQHVKEVIDAEPRIYDKRLQNQFEKLIFEPLLKVQQQPCNNRYVIIVVDALDECERDDHIKTVVRLLCRVKDIQSPRLKVFITSRPELPVRLGFSQDAVKGTYDDFLLHEIPPSIVEHDISAFLQHELEKIRADYNSDVPDDRQLPPTWPDQSDIKTLVMMAVPLFIFAATTCRFLTQRRFGDPRHQLRQVLEYKTGTGSSEVDLQSKLELTYQPALEQQLTELSPFDQEKVIEEFRRIVGPIVILKSPLSTTALENLLGIPRHVIDGRLDMLHSVLSIPKSPTSPVRLLHLSFRDFLVDPKQQSRNRFWVDERQTHRQLAAKCLALLKQSLHEDMCDLRAPATLRATVDVQKINNDLSPEVQYACLHWTYHTDQAGASDSLARDVDDFFRSHFLHWLETLSLMGRAYDSLSLLKSLQNKLTISCESELRELLSDAARFIRLNLFAIDAAPLQLYSSSIVFTPHESIVRQTFEGKVPSWVLLRPHADMNWDQCLQKFQGHSRPVNSVAFSHNSTLVASASNDKTVRIWHADTGECMQELKGHSRPVSSVAFSHNSTLVASASKDKTVRIWHTDTGECMQELKGHSSWVNLVAFSHDSTLVASASSDKTVRIWHADTGECMQKLKGHSSPVNSVAFSHNSTLVASASYDDTVRIWHTYTGECMQELKGHSSSVNSVAFSHDSTLVASASYDDTVRIWHTDTGECMQELKGHSRWVNSVAFSHDSTLVASASYDGTVRIWHADTGEYMQELKGHSSNVYSVAFSHDSTLVASASSDKTVRIWHAGTGECTQAVNIGGVTQTLSFEPSNAYLRTDKATIATDKASLRQSVSKSNGKYDTTRLRIDIGISPDGNWITWHDQNLLWLPVEFRPACSALQDSTLAIGCHSGKVIVLRLANP
ncbi:Vegetative incompatibility protein [Colletotrichum fructicola]|nr:Vegetative incompatibility protein [Colletotrichum fructicola]KAE9566112.1 Vegetative incompatibility protein [Colletotrichum fructicola]